LLLRLTLAVSAGLTVAARLLLLPGLWRSLLLGLALLGALGIAAFVAATIALIAALRPVAPSATAVLALLARSLFALRSGNWRHFLDRLTFEPAHHVR
jgi:hypothetical protein